MITKISTIGMSKDAWLAERAHTIGGSEIGAILGLNPWQSAYSLWAERTGRTPAFEGNLQTKFGTFMEDFVAKLFEEDSGLKVKRTNYIYRNDRYPVLHASPDRMVQGMNAGLEIKTTSAWNATKFHGEDFPGQYYAQCVQYMAVTECNLWFLAVLIGNQDFKIYQLTRDKTFPKPDWCVSSLYVEDAEITELDRAAEGFMDCLRKGVPPQVDGSEATTDALKMVYSDSQPGEASLFGREALIEEWFALKQREDEIAERQNLIRNTLCADLGAYETGICGGHRVSWKTQSRSTFDSKAFAKDFPDIKERYTKSSSTRTFTIK